MYLYNTLPCRIPAKSASETHEGYCIMFHEKHIGTIYHEAVLDKWGWISHTNVNERGVSLTKEEAIENILYYNKRDNYETT